MKLHLAVCLISLLPALACAAPPIVPDVGTKQQPFEPVLANDHSGPGRMGARMAFDKATGLQVIAALTRGGPAYDFGFRVGDVIIKIDKNDTSTLTQDEVSLTLHGRPGTGVELTIQRDDEPKFIVRAIERR